MKSIFCLATNEAHAQRIVDRLLSAEFANEDISILLPNMQRPTSADMGRPQRGVRRNVTTENATKAPEGAVTGAVTGGILGGSLGLLAGIGALAIPGLGPFIAAGPLMAALSGSAIGGSVGLLVGALVGLGIPEYEVKKYENALKSGQVLLIVQVDSDQEMNRAKEILKEEGATDISTSREIAKTRY